MSGARSDTLRDVYEWMAILPIRMWNLRHHFRHGVPAIPLHISPSPKSHTPPSKVTAVLVADLFIDAYRHMIATRVEMVGARDEWSQN
jgi:hypothetical protein